MEVIIKLPQSDVELQLHASQETQNGMQTWFIAFPAGDKLCICEMDGCWQTLGENKRGFTDDYIQELGRAIKPTDTNSLISKDGDETDNESDQIV